MIDNKTVRLELPLPDIDNFLEDDVKRLQVALRILDKAALVGDDGKLPISSIPSEATTDTRRWTATVFDSAGNGSPEGVVSASVGSTYRRKDGGAGTTFYVKETGNAASGWVAK